MRALVLISFLFVVCSSNMIFDETDEAEEDPSERCLIKMTNSGSFMESTVDCVVAAMGVAVIRSGKDLSETPTDVLEQELKCPYLILARECLVQLVTDQCGEEIAQEAREEISEGMKEGDPEFANCEEDESISSVSNEIYDEGRKLMMSIQSIRSSLPSIFDRKKRSVL